MSLVVDGLVVRYGGRVALSELHLDAPFGTVTGLVGSNGAGKSSALAAIGGQIVASEGMVWLDGVSLSGLNAWQRAQHGLGRSFQRASVFPGLTVRDDVGLGWEAPRVGSSATRLFGLSRRPGQRTSAVADALDLLDIGHLADRMTESLSLGDRRHVELARCLAGERRMLLLDEPSCNLDGPERSILGDALLAVAAKRGVGIVVVDHDLSLIGHVCSRVVVLDQGKTIFSGPPNELTSSASVRSAFLGAAVL